MISNVNANTSIETERQSMPPMAGSSTKAANALLDPCSKVFESTSHRDSENDTAPQDEQSEITKNVPGVPPPSKIAHRYICWDPTAVAAGYAARLTADLRSFRGLFECIDDRALATDVLDSLFDEIEKLEATYRARRAKAEQPLQCECSADIDEDGGDEDFGHDEEENSNPIDDAGDDENEEFLDTPEWREVDEASERGETLCEDEDGSNADAIHRTPSPVVVEPADNDYYGDNELFVSRRSAKFQRSSSNTDLVKDEKSDGGTMFNVLDRSPRRNWSAGDDGYGASVGSNFEIDWRLDGPSATNIHSTLSNLPAPTTPTARALPLAHIPDYAGRLDAPVQIQQPTYLKRVRPGITGLFGDFPEPFFAPLNAEIEAQTTSLAPTCARKAGTGRGVHRQEQCSRRARFDGPYRQHYLRHSSVPRGEGAGAPAGVRRNATALDLSRNRAA